MNSEHRERSINNRKTFLHGHSMIGDNYMATRNRGGCYACDRLLGTILNTYTNKKASICMEYTIYNAPNPKDGCSKSKPLWSEMSEFKPRNRRKRE